MGVRWLSVIFRDTNNVVQRFPMKVVTETCRTNRRTTREQLEILGPETVLRLEQLTRRFLGLAELVGNPKDTVLNG